MCCIETADGGTLFLDEIGEMTAGLQAKLLRFLEEKTFSRLAMAKSTCPESMSTAPATVTPSGTAPLVFPTNSLSDFRLELFFAPPHHRLI